VGGQVARQRVPIEEVIAIAMFCANRLLPDPVGEDLVEGVTVGLVEDLYGGDAILPLGLAVTAGLGAVFALVVATSRQRQCAANAGQGLLLLLTAEKHGSADGVEDADG